MKHVILLALFALSCLPAYAQTLPADVLKAKTLARLEAYSQAWDGVLGVAALDLTTGDFLSFNPDVVFPQASVIKIPILVEVFRQVENGAFALDAEVDIDESFLVAGSGRFQHEIEPGIPLRKTLREIIEAMIIESDNVATNVLIDLTGMEQVNRTMKELGLGTTRLERVMMDREAVIRNDENIATPREMVRLLQRLYSGDVMGDDVRRQMFDILSRVQAEMREVIPAAYTVASKPGGIPASRSESGIVYLNGHPFALSVMSTFNKSDDASPVTGTTRIIYDYFERLAHSNLYGHRTSVPLQ